MGTVVGFGSGHAIQGRYWEKGWIFTAGEVGSLLVLTSGCPSAQPPDGGMPCALAGIAGFLTFKIGEMIIVWIDHRRDYKTSKVQIFINPDGRTVVLGLGF